VLAAAEGNRRPEILCEARARPRFPPRRVRTAGNRRCLSRYARLGQRQRLGQWPQPGPLLEGGPAADALRPRRVAQEGTERGDRAGPVGGRHALARGRQGPRVVPVACPFSLPGPHSWGHPSSGSTPLSYPPPLPPPPDAPPAGPPVPPSL